MVPMTEEMKEAILDAHNKLRNDFATGKMPPFEPATHMATMEWDEDLAKAAAMNVHQCQMEHDDCGSKTSMKSHYSSDFFNWF